MKLRYIEEPSLQFGTNQHICPKNGIYEYSPFDLEQVRPEKITLGIIGKGESIDKILVWLESCKTHIPGKQSKNPLTKLFLNFCGFNKQIGFKCEVAYDDTYLRRLNNSDFDKIIREQKNLEERIIDIASLYLNEIKFLSKNKNPDVILCVLSENFITYIKEESEEETEESLLADTSSFEDENIAESIISKKEQNFRRYLKAKAMQYNVPIQIVRDRIYKPTSEMQDPATIAWNFFTALYYKALGMPWALIRKDASEATCYAGISFFKSRIKHLHKPVLRRFSTNLVRE